jgi:hypothetical protein
MNLDFIILMNQVLRNMSKNTVLAGRQWLTPVVLGTQEAEIRRIKIWSQPRPPSWKFPKQKKGWKSGSSTKSARLASAGSWAWVHTPGLQNKNK